MGNITIGHIFGVTDDDLNVAGYRANFYDVNSPNTSLIQMNGFLDEKNMDSSGWVEVVPEQTQRGTFVGGGSVGGTANLDYFNDWFRGIFIAQGDGDPAPEHFVPIPGATETFHLKRQAWVLLQWQVSWVNDAWQESNRSMLKLFIDGSPVDDQYRVVTQCAESSAGRWRQEYPHEGRIKSRFWCGHHLVYLWAGWHTVGLRLLADESVPQTRIWTRGLRHVHFYQ